MLQLTDTIYGDIKLTFKEDGHKYTDSLGNEYLSVTTFLHNYKKPFDKNYWLIKKSKELGISPSKLAKQWDYIKDEACDRGTITHNGLEDGIKGASQFINAIKYNIRENGEMITIADLPDINHIVKELKIKDFIELTNNKYPQIYKTFEYYVNKGYKIYAEIGAFLPQYLVSGTIDVLLIRDDKFVIGDWKTNRGGLKFEAGYYKKDKTQKPHQETNEWIKRDDVLLPPVNHLPDCNGSIYNLQLSTYAFMVEKIFNIPCVGLWLCHIDSDFELNEYGMPRKFEDGLYHLKQNPIESTKIYPMKYLKEEVNAILTDRLKVVNANVIRQQTLF